MKIYTRTGDDGETGLFGGPRTSKHDVRIEAYGEVDELNALVGLSIAVSPGSEFDEPLRRIQADLFSIGAELATPQAAQKGTQFIDDEDVDRLEGWIDDWDQQLPPLRTFILPGGAPLAAQLHVCRTVCRRAERRAWALAESVSAGISGALMRYLNRLSDLLFVMARAANQLLGQTETAWTAPRD